MQHVESQFPDQGSNPCLQQQKHRLLTPRMPGKSLGFLVLFTGVWNSQSCCHEQSSVPLHISIHLPKVHRCSYLHRWVSFGGADNMGTYTYSHRSVLTCVLMCIDLHMRTLRNTGTPVLLCLTDNALKKNWTLMTMLCQASTLAPFSLQHLLTSCLCHILIILAIFQTILLLLYALF